MNEKEVSEIRRRFRSDRSNITHIRGCYVNDKREIISVFNQSLGLMPEEEKEKYLALFKRTLSGTLGKNLIDIVFQTAQVVDSPEHKLLSALRDSSLQDEQAVQTFFQRVVQSLAMEGNYLILLAHDTYDVPYRARDGAKLDDASSDMFSYILCTVCPVKTTKPALTYDTQEQEFHDRKADWVVAAPELGFLFPAFDNRSTNLYNALYYSHNIADCHEEFIDAVFNTSSPMPAAAQKEAFQSILGDTLENECSFQVMQAVHEQLSDMIEAHKQTKAEDPLVISKKEVKEVLESCGVSEPHMAAFDVKFDTEFGTGTDLSPRNIIDDRQFEVRTPDVVIHVNPERRDLVETRVIGGTKYILICADEGVEVNGVSIHIPEQ